MKLDNFKKTKTFINTKEIQTGDLLRIVKTDGKIFGGMVLFNTGFKYYNIVMNWRNKNVNLFFVERDK